jgi:hypothetical protein
MGGHNPRRLPLDLAGLSGREEVFRLSGASKTDPKIDTWFNRGSLELRAIAQRWSEKMRECGDDVRELMHAGRESERRSSA